MALTAPLSRQTRNWWMMMILAAVVLGLWLVYDGYFSKKFIEEHTIVDEVTGEKSPDTTLMFNQKSPPCFFGAAVLMGLWVTFIWRKQVVADETDLVIDHKLRIPYDNIQQIDKTDFEKKGRFVLTYKNDAGKDVNCTLSDTSYDGLGPILEHLVAQLSGSSEAPMDRGTEVQTD